MSTVHTVEWIQDRSDLSHNNYQLFQSVNNQTCMLWVWSIRGCALIVGVVNFRSGGVRSLKVVVQRALIELPRSLRRKCSVEEDKKMVLRRSRRVNRDSVKEQDESDSQLVTCQSCDITVHRGDDIINLLNMIYLFIRMLWSVS